MAEYRTADTLAKATALASRNLAAWRDEVRRRRERPERGEAMAKAAPVVVRGPHMRH